MPNQQRQGTEGIEGTWKQSLEVQTNERLEQLDTCTSRAARPVRGWYTCGSPSVDWVYSALYHIHIIH